ncbi:hypothetical protein [Nostoc sp. PCC 7107]|uniref:hypothetical protein n=1 Tax=Nostoc sp. PCC 7107 TaxID=317936 RepID=UPI00029ECD82|nr:hypothetical protein [Nostoc sp. PCC 7107]AFY45462.1 hypothetical protein Nos7107_4944 [Nostoc sp. PCC 7107]
MTDLVLNNSIPWEYQKGIDTPKSWEAFCVYRDMGVNRTLMGVSRVLKKRIELISRWSKKGNWGDRVLGYDLENEKIKREVNERERLVQHRNKIIQYREAIEDLGWIQLDVASKCLDICNRALKKYQSEDKELKPIDVKALSSAGVSVAEIGSRLLAESLGINKLLDSLEVWDISEDEDVIDIGAKTV